MYCLELEFSLGICPEVGLLDHMVILFLVFKGTSLLFSIAAAPICIPINSIGGFPLIHTLSSIYLYFLMVAILTHVRLYLTVVLICISLTSSKVEQFLCLWRNVYLGLLLVFDWVVCHIMHLSDSCRYWLGRNFHTLPGEMFHATTSDL